jgi:hypothetical protein
MSDSLLARLRSLRRRAFRLSTFFAADLQPYRLANGVTFSSRAGSVSDTSVATSCTIIMAAAAGEQWAAMFGEGINLHKGVRRAYAEIFRSKWDSGGLQSGNAFTKALVGRSAAKCVAQDLVDAKTALEWQRRRTAETLRDQLRGLFRGAPDSLRVGDYSPSPTVAFWLLDSVDLLSLQFSGKTWIDFARWVAQTFGEEFSRLSANHVALMDPVALAFSACLVAKLRQVRRGLSLGSVGLPSENEVAAAIRAVLREQTTAGIWPKYFPLFHYPRVGANHCFSFEVFEAILDTFRGQEVLEDEAVLVALERGLTWCEENRLDGERTGWNSGGVRDQLIEGSPEAWATGTVYFFLFSLLRFIGDRLQSQILEKYTSPRADRHVKSWDNLLDVKIRLQGEQALSSLKKLLMTEIIKPAVRQRQANARGSREVRHRVTPPGSIETQETGRRSALLFGPPGTSKTSYARAAAERLGWPLIEITPSHFLLKGLPGIYERADEIFDDLMDLHDVLVFFDEMDALVQSRDDSPELRLDALSRFLTTSMLPKLAELHRNDRVIVLMATNHQQQFDAAIKRPGRFDLMLCVGPPMWVEKKGKLNLVLGSADKQDANAISRVIGPAWRSMSKTLDKFTVDDLQSLLAEIKRRTGKSSLLAAVKESTFADLRQIVTEWDQEYIVLRPQLPGGKPNPLVAEFTTDKDSSRRQ